MLSKLSSACRVYARESKKIKAKAIDSNTTALDDNRAEEEVGQAFPTMPFTDCRKLITVYAHASMSAKFGEVDLLQASLGSVQTFLLCMYDESILQS